MRTWSARAAGLFLPLALAACSSATTGQASATAPPPGSPSPPIATTSPTTGAADPGFAITPVTVTDLAAASSVSYEAVTTKGLSPDAAAAADAAVAGIADVDMDEWRAIEPTDCTITPAPCGEWQQTATEITCVDPYLCLLVVGSGVFPGAATSSESAAAVAIDPATGQPLVLADALGTATIEELLGFLTEKVARFQEAEFDIGCGDPMHVSDSPLSATSISTWLPTAAGLKVWFEKYAVAPGSAGVVPMLITWDELAHADDYVELGRTRCAPTNVDADGLPVLEEGGRVTAGGILCPATPSDLPELVPGVNDVRYTRVIQIVLQSYAMYSGPLDGRFGSSTRKAVREFQQNGGVSVDGLVGPKTWGALQASYCRNWN